MFCTKCGTNVGTGNFCPTCGNKMPTMKPVTPVVEQVVTPTVEQVVTPAVEQVVTPAVEQVVTPAVEQVVTPAVEQVVTPAVEQVVTPTVEQAAPVEMVAPIEMSAPVEMVTPVVPIAPVEPIASVEPVATENGQTMKLDPSLLQPEYAPVGGEIEMATNENVRPRVQQQVVSASSTFAGAPINNVYQAQPQNTLKPKKKFPKKLAIIAVVIALLGVAVYFAWPMIEGVISPKSKAIHALQNMSENMKKNVETSLTGGFNFELTNTRITSDIELKKAVFGNVDYTDALKTKKFFALSEVEVDDGQMAGKIGIGDSSNPVVSVEYYVNGTRAYFKIPELTSQAFYVPVDINVDLSDLSSISSIGNVYSDEMTAKYVKALNNDIFDAVSDFWEDLDYDYVGKDTYKSSNGDIKVGVYNVTITEKSMKKFVKTLLTNIFDDKDLSSIVSLISLTGYSKESIIDMVDSELVMPAGFEGIKFQMYVSDKGDITKIIFRASDYGVNENAQIGIAFVGKKNATDVIEFEVIADKTTAKASFGSEDGNVSANFTMTPDQDRYPGEFISLDIKGTTSGDVVNFSNISVKGKVDGEVIDFECAASLSTKPFTYLSYDASNFKGAVNPDNMSSSKKQDLMEEIVENMDILDKILSPSLKNDLLGK